MGFNSAFKVLKLLKKPRERAFKQFKWPRPAVLLNVLTRTRPTVPAPSHCSNLHLPQFQFWYSSLALCKAVELLCKLTIPLWMESAVSSETLLPIYRITRRHIPQYGNRNGLGKYTTSTDSFIKCHIPRLGPACCGYADRTSVLL